MRYRPNMGLLYGRLRHTGVVLVIMLAMSLVMWHNVDSYAAAEEKLDINTADKEELKGLPGIGDAFSDKIVNYREQHGCFLDIYEIMNIKRIGTKTFDKIKDLIVVAVPSLTYNLSSIDCEVSKNRVREKVKKVEEEMNEEEKGRTTFAVAEVYVYCSLMDGEIETWVSNAGQDHNIRQGILDAAGPNAEEVAYPDDGDHYPRDEMGNHAEMGLLRKAQMDNVRILSIRATRKICEDCANNLREAGFNNEFVNPPCNVESKDKLAAMWSEIRNSI